LHDIRFVMPDLVLPLFHFQFLLHISPRQSYAHVFCTSNMFLSTSNVLALHYLLSHFLSKDGPNLGFVR
jgi:hypothetical protein